MAPLTLTDACTVWQSAPVVSAVPALGAACLGTGSRPGAGTTRTGTPEDRVAYNAYLGRLDTAKRNIKDELMPRAPAPIAARILFSRLP
jgi:hypothetical protein